MSGSPGPRAARPPTAVSAARIRSLVARHGTPLLIVDCEAVRRQYLALKHALPGVDLYYALKPLPLAAVVAAETGTMAAKSRSCAISARISTSRAAARSG